MPNRRASRPQPQGSAGHTFRCSRKPAFSARCRSTSGRCCWTRCVHSDGDALILAKRERSGRDVIGVAMIERLIAKRGARVVSAAGERSDSDDPAGVLIRRLFDSFSEYERLLCRSRTRAALAAKRRGGERISRFAPYGFQLAADGRRLERDATEQQTVQAIRAHRAAGLTFQAIAEALNCAGLRTRCGSLWRSSICAMC
jgi:DNA invertase Pin-like site-specific DNA recombinase